VYIFQNLNFQNFKILHIFQNLTTLYQILLHYIIFHSLI